MFYQAARVVGRFFDLAGPHPLGPAARGDTGLPPKSYFDLYTDFGDIVALLIAKVSEIELAALHGYAGPGSR
ncbi:hypothetical protein [Mycobacterium asiaticum]|uniref:hypothetical protein n=1 Tax=Mycobacterium asiaticum TaxID=1790 RepID=UPI000B014741|nr:hypothetical protein [Mycobacterium asiaticum]